MSPHRKCQEHTKHAGNSQFLSGDFIFKTKFKPGYCSLLFGECYPASPQGCQTLCCRIPLPSCLHTAAYDATEDRSPGQEAVSSPFASLLSPTFATEAEAPNAFMVLQVTMEAGWPDSPNNTLELVNVLQYSSDAVWPKQKRGAFPIHLIRC